MSNTLWCTSSAPIFNRQTKTKTFQYDDIQLLQAEAQKIRNWHLQTEINTKNMEKVVQNLRLTVESQRKSLLEVQLEYEGIGNQMQEEVNKRTTCLQRIDATRDLCNLIKSQACELEDTLHFCGDVKDSIECSNTAQNSSFQKLVFDFQSLSEDFEKAKIQYKDELSTLEKQSLHDKEEFSEKIQIHQNKMAACNECLDEDKLTIDVLMHTVIKEQNELTKARESIKKTNSSNLELLEIISQLRLSLKVSDSINKDQQMLLKSKENQLNAKVEWLETVKLANAHLKQQLEEEHVQLDKKQEVYLEDIKELENKFHTQTIKAEMLEKIVEEMNGKLKCYSDDLISLRSSKEDLDASVAQMSDHREELLEKYANACEDKKNTDQSLSQCRDTISQLLTVVAKTGDQNKALEEKLNHASNARQQVEAELQAKIEENLSLKLRVDENTSIVADLSANVERQNTNKSEIQTKLIEACSENTELKTTIVDFKKKLNSKEEAEQKLLSNIRSLEENIEKEKSKLTEKEDLVRTLKETIKIKEAEVEKQKNAADLANGQFIEREKSKDTELQGQMNKLIETVKEKEHLVYSLQEAVRKHEAEIIAGKEAARLAAGLYEELNVIKNDQTLELTKVCRELQTARDELAQIQENNRKMVENLKVEHLVELQKLQGKLNGAEDKLLIKCEESAKKKPTVLIHTGSAKKRNKRPHFTALTGHDISSDFDESFSAMPVSTEIYSRPRQPPPRHSTPIRASMPSHNSYSCKKMKSSTKPSWKHTASRTTVKTPAKKNKTISKEDNWFDTDRVYGFFD